MAQFINKSVYLPSNTGGIMVQVDNSTPVDNIFIFTDGTNRFKWINNGRGEYPLSQAKILANDVTDKSTILQSVLDSVSVKTIVLDAQQSVVINSTINAGGKTIRFTPGAKFTGTGTINNAIIDADYDQQIFDTSISLTNCKVAEDKFSVRWYGAVNDDSADSSVAIQKAVDTAIENQKNIKNVYFPCGSYLINNPILVYKWDDIVGIYLQVTINLIGEFDYAGTYPNGTRIYCGYTDKFAIGIQQGKSCKVEGFFFLGGFAPPALGTGYSWYSLTLAQFTDGVSRDQQYSPYSAVVIDPFTNSTVPPDGGYPGLSSYYRGLGGTAGCTGIYIRDCYFTNFVIGVMVSPNGETRNAELTFIERCQFANIKICVAGTQDQEKANKIYDLMCWANTHTIFATGVYGTQIPGNWYVEVVNVAGAVNQLVYNNGLSYYPSHYEKIFAEGLGKIGFLGSDLQSGFKDSIIDLQRFDPGGGYAVGLYDWCITGYNTLFENCVIRYYGTAFPVAIMGRNVFKNCYFESTPYSPSGILIDGMPYDIDAYGPSIFDSCTINNTRFLDSQDAITQQTSVESHIVYGKKKFIDKLAYRQGRWQELEIDGGETCSLEYWAAIFNEPAFSVVVQSDRTAQISVTASHINKFQLNCPIICQGNNYLMGIVTNINTSTNVITVSYIPPAIVTGGYYIGCVYPKKFYGAFIGDFTSGSNTITNVVFDTWGVDTTLIQGTVIELPQIINFAFPGKYQNCARILSYNAGSRTITLDIPSNQTQTGRYISLGNPKKYLRSYDGAAVLDVFVGTTIVPIGSEIYIADSKFLVTKTGFLSVAVVGGGETRQAQWVKLGQNPQELADDATADLMGLRIYYNTTSSIVKIKNGSTWYEVEVV